MQEILERLWPGFKIDKQLGEGSFGKVYKIRREESGYSYVYALKIISIPSSKAEVKAAMNDGMDEASVTTYFRSIMDDVVKEVQMMYQLKGNTNIVNYDEHRIVPQSSGIGWDIYIRMELLTPFFDHYHKVENEYSNRDVAQLGIDICNGLELCQKYNIIHRDIKPENIFISKIGNYKLGDFGIARQMEKTATAMSKKGTYLYMAPEVFRNEDYDLTVDIYSLGIVMYRFLNQNRVPFLPTDIKTISYSDKELALYKRIKGEELPSPCNADKQLADIVLKACAFNPGDRYSSPGEMKRELEAIFNNLSTIPMKSYHSNDESKDIDQKDLYELEDTYDQNYGEESTVGLFDENERLKKIEEEKRKRELLIEKEEQEKQKKQKKQKKQTKEKKQKNNKQLLKYLPIALGLVLVCIVGYYFASTTKVPNVIGLTEDIAKAQLQESSLEMNESSKVYSDKYKKGYIVLNDSIGKRLKKGSTIDVVVSLGVEFEMIDFKGSSRVEIENQLLSYGLNVEIIEEFSDEFEEGTIMSSSPNAGVLVYEGDRVELVVSKGSEPFELKDYKGSDIEDVLEFAEEKGLEIEITEKYSSKTGKNLIISQTPEAGTIVNKGDKITFVVSKGAEQVVVPKLIGKSKSSASSALKNAGFKLGNVTYSYSSSSEGTVISQEVTSGKKTDKGSSIDIVISLGKRPEPTYNQSNDSSSNATDITGDSSTDITEDEPTDITGDSPTEI